MRTAEKDENRLDGIFPFRVEEYVLTAEHDRQDAFHWHNYMEITYVEEGNGIYYVNGKAYEVTGGDIILFHAMEPHGWQILESQMKVIVMVFSNDVFTGSELLTEYDFLRPVLEYGIGFENKIDHADTDSQRIIQIFREILYEYLWKDRGYQMVIKANLLRILTFIARRNPEKTRNEILLKDKKKALDRLQIVFDYINQGFGGEISLSEAAAKVYMSPNYFSSYFHSNTLISFSEYVTMRRIRHANELLATTDKSISDIAMECGFRNLSNFYRLYKKHTGSSPKNHRI